MGSDCYEQIVNRVMTMLLDGVDPILDALRNQFRHSTCESFRLTGCGFFADFSVDEQVHALINEPDFSIGDIIGEMKAVENGVGFTLFIRNGRISWLEAYTFGDEQWPAEVPEITLKYVGDSARDLSAIRSTPDWPQA